MTNSEIRKRRNFTDGGGIRLKLSGHNSFHVPRTVRENILRSLPKRFPIVWARFTTYNEEKPALLRSNVWPCNQNDIDREEAREHVDQPTRQRIAGVGLAFDFVAGLLYKPARGAKRKKPEMGFI